MSKRFFSWLTAIAALAYFLSPTFFTEQSNQLSMASVLPNPVEVLKIDKQESTSAGTTFSTEVGASDWSAEESDPDILPLRSLRDIDLQNALRLAIKSRPDWARLAAEKRLSIGLVDMENGQLARFADLNGRHMMYAASLPKIAVLAAALDAIERGELNPTEEVRSDLRLMIARSNNAATTRTIDRVGFENIERTMTDPGHKLYDPAFGGGLWVGKRYAAGGRRYPDPIKGISHAATAEQVARFYYLLANNELVSPSACMEMKRYLVDPELHHKFVNTLDRLAPQARVYRKSGSWRSYHADSVWVQGPERNYILVALIDDPAGEQMCREIAEVVDRLLQTGV